MLVATTALALLFTAAPPAVAVLPLQAGEGVSKQQAMGVDALLRQRLEASDFLRPLAPTKKDAREAFRCGRDPGCLSGLAYARGADLLAAGFVDGTPEGFELTLVVVTAAEKTALRQVKEPVRGTAADMGEWLDRAIRRAFKPEALAGGLLVRGEPRGAKVFVNEELAGSLPFEEPLAGLVEGEHSVRVEHEGYTTLSRRIEVRFREVRVLNVTLASARSARLSADDDEEAGDGLLTTTLPAVLVGTGVALLAGGAVFGGLSLLEGREVERRAAAQQLVFPRDEGLFLRGGIFAWTANALYGLGVVSLGGAGLAYVVGAMKAPAPAQQRLVAPPTEGAPRREELRPGVGP
jgi:hypothetical protein